MSNNPRDTQFAGFAKLLVQGINAIEIDPNQGYVLSPMERLIAQRAYDLTQHAVGHALEYLHECGREIPSSMHGRISPTIPDITDWKQWGFPNE